MDYIQITGNLEKGNQLMLEPEDWTKDQWATFLELFDLYINRAHRCFTVEYSGKDRLKVGFKFDDIGNTVFIA